VYPALSELRLSPDSQFAEKEIMGTLARNVLAC